MNGAKKSLPSDIGVNGEDEGMGMSKCSLKMSVKAETSGRGRRALKRCRSDGGSDGRGSEKNRTLFPDGGRAERRDEGS